MKFIGREKERKALEDYYHSAGFQMVIVYGRRRVGKTCLLNEFTADKDCIFFTAVEASYESNLRAFSEAVSAHFGGADQGIRYDSFERAFRVIKDQAETKKLVLVIDEYPYLALSDSSMASVLQKTIDTEWKQSNIMLILSGSSISFMEDEVLGEKSPLFGRRTAQIDVRPFDYLTASRFVESYSPEEKAIAYGATGGIAKYLSLFRPEESADSNLKRLFFSESGYLYEEPKNLLRQEFRNIALYNSIIEAVANGAVQMNEISQRTGMDTARLSQALARLISVRIIRKDEPILNESRKFIQYQVNDGMFRFWYRFVLKATTVIENDMGELWYEKSVKPELHDFMGLIFEEMCQEWTRELSRQGGLEPLVFRVGKWRGHDNQNKAPADIDVVGVNDVERTAVIGECKFRNELFGIREYEKCLDRARLLPGYETKQFLMFSKSGFSKDVKARAKKERTRLVTLREMYG